jgi:ABC-type phosphate transport system substrate-binding protein
VAAVGLLATVLLLSGCGSDNNASAGSGSGSGSAAANANCGGKKDLKASGSSAQANAMTRFIAAYQQACSGYSLDYTSNGSGAGVKEFTGGQTDFGGSDSPLNADKGEVAAASKRCGSDAWNLPVVFGPIAVTYNVSGVDKLVLDGPTLGKIFSGGITTWNDPAIAKLNPGVSLPADKINVVYRSDESGTTDNFQKYLDSASDGTWTKGTGKTFNGGVGEGAKGNEGTSAAIKIGSGAEQGREHRPAVEARQAEPVDRAVPTDEGGALGVAEQGVVLDQQRHRALPPGGVTGPSGSRATLYRRVTGGTNLPAPLPCRNVTRRRQPPPAACRTGGLRPAPTFARRVRRTQRPARRRWERIPAAAPRSRPAPSTRSDCPATHRRRPRWSSTCPSSPPVHGSRHRRRSDASGSAAAACLQRRRESQHAP